MKKWILCWLLLFGVLDAGTIIVDNKTKQDFNIYLRKVHENFKEFIDPADGVPLYKKSKTEYDFRNDPVDAIKLVPIKKVGNSWIKDKSKEVITKIFEKKVSVDGKKTLKVIVTLKIQE